MSHKPFNINNMPNIKEEKDIDIDHIVFLLCVDIDHIVFLLCEKTQITMVFFSANQKPIYFCLDASWAALISA